MGNLTVGEIRNATYKLLREYYPVAANIDINLTYIVDTELINRYYYEVAEIEGVEAVVKYSHFPIKNLLGEMSTNFGYKTHTNVSVDYNAASARSYTFEVNKNCTAYVYEQSGDGTLTTLATIECTSVTGFTEYRGLFTPATVSNVAKLSFVGNGEYQIKNVAMYPYYFDGVSANIPPFKQYSEFQKPSDYLDIHYVEMENVSSFNPNFTDYNQDKDKWRIKRQYSAEFSFYYYRQVSAIDSASTSKFEVTDKTALLIPFALAGTVLNANGYNLQAGSTFINTFEAKKAQIAQSENNGKQEIYNIKGW